MTMVALVVIVVVTGYDEGGGGDDSIAPINTSTITIKIMS